MLLSFLQEKEKLTRKMEMIQICTFIRNNSALKDQVDNGSIIEKNAIGKTSHPCLIVRISCHLKNIFEFTLEFVRFYSYVSRIIIL